jgi:hypothetical protein
MKSASKGSLSWAIITISTLLPGMGLAEKGVNGTYYTRCDGEFAISQNGERQPAYDGICKLKPAHEVGSPDRCTNTDTLFCEGGVPDPINSIPRDVPNGGINWYVSTGVVGTAQVRCVCGCFTADTEVLTNMGWHSIDRILNASSSLEIQIALPALGNQEYSSIRKAKDFTKGPETIPVLKIETTHGNAIRITTKHPVPTFRKGTKVMVQASALKVNDVLFSADGSQTAILAISQQLLPKDGNVVYNVSTGDKRGEGGIIAANGLQMGDLQWQMRLSERESRASNLLGVKL